uniref:Uncharacterized protein n=1 Tax=Pseudo-nitzschia australis TaxID=44445 RepID=A0A7S4AME3_9STRA
MGQCFGSGRKETPSATEPTATNPYPGESQQEHREQESSQRTSRNPNSVASPVRMEKTPPLSSSTINTTPHHKRKRSPSQGNVEDATRNCEEAPFVSRVVRWCFSCFICPPDVNAVFRTRTYRNSCPCVFSCVFIGFHWLLTMIDSFD